MPGDSDATVRSILAPDLALAHASLLPPVDLWLVRPPVLRLPLATSVPAVVHVDVRVERPKVTSYRFAPAASAATAAPTPATGPATPGGRRATPARGMVRDPAAQSKRVRIAPPRDVVKLSEKFFYLLQPDLETTLQAEQIGFPRPPFPFQLEGMAFLVPRHSAVLADEMGLGKSMQAISSIRLLVRSGQARRVLVVCPKGLVSNWARELADWAPELVVAIVEGDQERRRWQWSLPDVPVKLVNYEVLVRDRALVAALELEFDLLVLDEAQRIKNRGSHTSAAVRAVPRHRSWALTGTPVENSPDDLVGLFEFVAPGQIDRSMTPRAMGAAVADQILRRTKDKVLQDMPPRLDRDERIELTAEQRETYRLAEEEGVLRLAGLGQEATIRHVFELVLRLKQICNFDTATGESAKLDRLTAELEEVQASGRKALVFSQWTGTLARLHEDLARFGALEYHGGMSTAARDEAIRRFRHDPGHAVLLLSYGAGAVGLNLQFAEYVFLFDRWWNPAIEDQAINRAHRIGAAGPVTVTRFLAADTIEERIDEVLRGKRDLSAAILAEARATVAGGLTAEDLFALFRLAPPRRAAA